MTNKPNEELPIIDRAFELALEMTRRVRKLPRDIRYALGDRILGTTYDIVDLLLEAKFSRNKRALLDRANVLLDRLRFQVRLCNEEKLITPRQYEFLARLIHDTGNMLGGWRKSINQ